VLVLLLTYFYTNAIFPSQAVRTISAWGAGLFLAVIALVPSVLTRLSGLTTYFVGGTGILILVGVLVDAYRPGTDGPAVRGSLSHFQPRAGARGQDAA
jgi:hypothetical protein